MRPLNDREQRTLRFALIGITLYLALFFGARGWGRLEKARADYQKLVADAARLQKELLPYENKVLLIEKLRGVFQFDPGKLNRATVVAEASAAIQKAGMSGGILIGPIRESPPRPSASELASMQLEATGPPPAVLNFLQRLQTLGYPLIIDAVQFSSEPSKPGVIKLNLTIVILDFEQWKPSAAQTHSQITIDRISMSEVEVRRA